MGSTSEAANVAFFVVEVIGSVAFAVSGVMAAARASMDWLGAVVLAVLVAIGGGTIRDVLIGHLPVNWIEHMWPVLVAMGSAAVVLIILRIRPKNEDLTNWTPMLIADAAGLSAFVIVGAQVALEANLNYFIAVILGTITGVGGGVLRDVLTGNKPVVLVGQIYAIAGIVGACFYVFLIWLGVGAALSIWLPMAVIFGIRALAIRRDWRLPKAAVSQ